MLVVKLGVGMMRIAKVVNRHDQRDTGLAQRRRHLAQFALATGVEAEVHMEDVEVGVVFRDPVRVKHHRRPPSPLAARLDDVRQAHDGPVVVRVAEVTHVDVAGRHRCDPDRTARPLVGTTNYARGAQWKLLVSGWVERLRRTPKTGHPEVTR